MESETPSKLGEKKGRDEKGRFLKGVLQNPKGLGGRPLGSVSITTALKRLLAADGMDEKVARAWLMQAVSGKGSALKELLDRVDGPVKTETKVELSTGSLTAMTDDELDARIRELEGRKASAAVPPVP